MYIPSEGNRITRSFSEYQLKKLINDIAYYLWEKAGKPEGQSDHFWCEAEKIYRNNYRGKNLPTLDKVKALLEKKSLKETLYDYYIFVKNKLINRQGKPALDQD